MKDRSRQEVDDIMTGIITGNEEEIDGTLLDWNRFDKRNKTNQNNGIYNKQLRLKRKNQSKIQIRRMEQTSRGGATQLLVRPHTHTKRKRQHPLNPESERGENNSPQSNRAHVQVEARGV